jgi:hypothetical protein
VSSSVPRPLLAIPFILVALGAVAAQRAVPKIGDRIGRRLSSAVNVLRLNRPPPWRRDLLPPSIGPGPTPAAQNARPAVAAREDGGAAVALSGPILVRVPAKLVQRAIDDQGAHLHATDVQGPDGSPAGFALTGVAGFASGLQDGDVVVAIEGEPVRNLDAATDIALSWIARDKPMLHATALRNGTPVTITVELPPAPRAAR